MLHHAKPIPLKVKPPATTNQEAGFKAMPPGREKESRLLLTTKLKK